MFKILFTGLIIVIPVFAQEIMTAEDAIAIGLKNNFDIQIARNNREIATNNKGKGTAEFLPVLDVSASYRVAHSKQETNSPFSFGNSDTKNLNAGIAINWTLFDVKKDLGSVSSTDYLNAQVSFNNDRSTLLNQELRLLVAKKELNIFLGRDVSTPTLVKKEINISPLLYSIDELQNLALERNSTLSIAEQGKIIAEQNISLAESPFYPRLLFNFNYNYTDLNSETSRFDDPVKAKTNEYIGGLTLTYNLFNGMRDNINRQNALLRERNSELSLQDVRNKIAGLVRERFVTMQKRLELMELEEQNVVSATQNLTLQQDKYNIGATTSLEFRDAQVNLIRSQSTLIVARFLARISRLEIEQLIGNIQID